MGRWGGWTNSIQVGVLQSLVPQRLIGDRDDLELAAQTASAQRWYMHQVRLKRSNDNCYKFRAGTNLSHHVGHGCLGRGDGAEGTCCILGIAFVSHDAGGESSHGWGSRRAWRWAWDYFKCCTYREIAPEPMRSCSAFLAAGSLLVTLDTCPQEAVGLEVLSCSTSDKAQNLGLPCGT